MTPTEMDEIGKLTKPLIERNDKLSQRVLNLMTENVDLHAMLESACMCSERGMPFIQWPRAVRTWYEALRMGKRHGDPVTPGNAGAG